ncbi:MAG TPA: tetratricopeptide repeat protein [Vicinamibacteria bacterium]|nr:tetratricopeptide repeat protein [Vicinamibacteria bacterium]
MSRALPLEQAALGRWLRLSPAIFGALGLWLSAGFVRSGELDGGSLSLRVRGASLREVVWMLSRLTDQAYVVDGDVVGKVDVELREVTAAEVEARLAALGVFFTGPGTVRRVSTAPVPDLELPGTGHRVSLQWVRPGDTRDVLRLMSDIIGIEIVAPAGPLGRFSLFAEEKATADQMSAILASSGLEARRQGTRIHVRRQGEPKAVVLPLNAGGLTGHAAYRSGESAPAAQRPPGMEGYLATEARLWGLASNGDAWMAFVHTPDGSAFIVEAGYRLYDGVIESVDAGGAIARTEDGRTVVWRLQPAAEGVSGIADDLDVILERAAALRDERRFDESEHLLLSALQGWRRTDEGTRTRAALADLRFEWSQALSARGELECAVRVLEAAYEIDRADRPWQAAEDLNEMGKAWTALGEPERAVNPHREALEIARSGAERGAPRPFLCVRTHERTPWVEGDALDGLANAERVRGRLSEALALYERALSVWSSVNDPTGRSTALTGWGSFDRTSGSSKRPRHSIGRHSHWRPVIR